MPTDLIDAQDGFAGGYNSAGTSRPIDATQFAAMTNMRVLRSGEMAKRPGFKSVSATAVGKGFYWKNGSTIFSNGANLWTGGLNLSLPSLVLTSRSTTTAQHYGAAAFRDAAADCLYLAPGTGKLSKWDGTTFSDRSIGLTLNLRQVWVYNQRLFGVTGTNQTLYWSALNNGDTIGEPSLGGGSATIRTFGGQILFGGFALGGTNILVHQGALSKFVGITFDDIAIQAGTSGFATDIGTLTQDSYCVVDGVGYIVSRRGLALVTEQGVTLAEQPEFPDPTRELLMAGQFAGDDIDPALTWLAYNERAREIWISLTNTGGACTISLYSTVLRRFVGAASPATVPTQGIASAGSAETGPQFLLVVPGSGVAGLDFSDRAFDTYLDFSTAYPSSVRCRRFFTQQPLATKNWLKATVLMGNGSGQTAATAGSTTGASVSYTTPVGGTVAQTTIDLNAQAPTLVPLSGQGASVDVTITDGAGSVTGWSVVAVGVVASDAGAIGR